MLSAIYRCSEYLRVIRDGDLPSLWQSLSTGRTIPCLPETFALKSVGGEVRFIIVCLFVCLNILALTIHDKVTQFRSQEKGYDRTEPVRDSEV